MSMHKVHFINGTTEIFFGLWVVPEQPYYKGYADASERNPVSIPLTSVLYVEVI